MTRVKQLNWSKLQPPQKKRGAPRLSPKERKLRWATQSQAKGYVDMLFQKKINDMMDRDV